MNWVDARFSRCRWRKDGGWYFGVRLFELILEITYKYPDWIRFDSEMRTGIRLMQRNPDPRCEARILLSWVRTEAL
jgi:hypothetical protein